MIGMNYLCSPNKGVFGWFIIQFCFSPFQLTAVWMSDPELGLEKCIYEFWC